MQAVKVGWVGQTFALAKCSDSRGKKPRSRKTKEERRSMVDSFIKKYRKSNNGNFPSLNLTHKEVGGSFYTVREIVRDIIQENKVLGPADFTLEEQYTTGTGFEVHQSHLSLSSVIGNTVCRKQLETVFSSKEDEGEPEELGATYGDYETMESKDSETCRSYQKDSSVPQFAHEEVVAHQQQNIHSNGDFVDENFVEEERRKPSKEEIKKKNDNLAYREISREKMDVVEHALELPADAVASPLSSFEDVLSANKDDYGIYKTEHSLDLVLESSADKSHEIDKTSDSIDLQKTTVVVDAVVSVAVAPDDTNATEIKIDLETVDSAASEVVLPEDTHATKIISDRETGNGYVQIHEKSSPAYVREAFSSASSSSLIFSQNEVSEAAETCIANPSPEGTDFHTNGTSLVSGVTVLELGSTLNDADVEVSQNDSVLPQSHNPPNLVTNAEPVFVPSDAQVQTGKAPRESTDIRAAAEVPRESADTIEAAKITGEADLKLNSSIKNETLDGTIRQSLGKDNKKAENNPLWIAIKAFIDAFAKFWTE